MGDIKERYETLSGERSNALILANTVERYMVDTGNYQSMESGKRDYAERTWLYDDIGVIIHRALASVIVNTAWPPDVPWYRYVLTPDMEGRVTDTEKINSLLAEGERIAMDQFAISRCKSTLYGAFLGAISGGQCLVHVRDDHSRSFPLAQWTQRWHKGRRVEVILHEVLEDTSQATTGRDDLYTRVDYDSGKISQQLVRQSTGQEVGEKDDISDDNPARWFVCSLELPVGQRSYAFPFGYYHITKIRNVNALMKAFMAIVIEASKIYKGVRRGSGLNPHTIENLESGRAFWIKNIDDVMYFSAESKIRDLLVVKDKIEEDRNELKMQFLYGLLERLPQPDTATLVRRLVEELNQIGAQFFTHIADWVQLPLATALQDITGFGIEASDAGLINPAILTGMAAFSRHEDAERILVIARQCVEINPNFGIMLDMRKFWTRLGESFSVDVEDLMKAGGGVEEILQELAIKIDEDPAAAEKVVAFVQQVMGQAQAGPAGPATAVEAETAAEEQGMQEA